ncbi:hypothetical protein P376_5784 [Streptomyces sp. HCCB10043]|nr:hypothetical protein P376_5784 [Streptomyces sp. HCCB10043]
MRRGRLGSGIRLAHDPQSSIDRHLPGNEKSPRTGGDAALTPTRRSHRSGLFSAAR